MALLGLFGIGLLLAVVVGGVFGLINASLPQKVKALRHEVDELRERIRLLEGGEPREAAAKPQPQADVLPKPQAAAASPASSAAAPAPKKTKPPRKGEFLRNAEGRFASYWTGILGVLAMVAGFSFLAVLTALRLAEFPRFLLLCLVSGLFWGAAYVVKRRSGSDLFAAWFRSAAGALFLFACVGSSAIPWLAWVQSAPQGYALLGLGLALNLFFALRGPYQLFTAFHGLISLTALAVAPPTATALIAATLVAALSTLPSLKRPWDLQLLVSETAFFAFILGWVLRLSDPGIAYEAMALAGLVAGLSPVLAAPYFRRELPTGGLKLAARGAAWIFIALGTAAFGRSFRGVSLIFLLQALLAYLPARFSRGLSVKVRGIDLFAGLFLALIAAFGLLRLEFDLSAALFAAVLVSLLSAADLRHERALGIAALSSALIFTTLLTATVLFRVLFRLDLPLFGGGEDAALTIFLLIVSAVYLAGAWRFLPDSGPGALLVSLSLGVALLGLYAAPGMIQGYPAWLRFGGGILSPFVLSALFLQHREQLRFVPYLSFVTMLLIHGASLAGADLISEATIAARSGHAFLLLFYTLLGLFSSVRVRKADATKPGPPYWPGMFIAVFDAALLLFILTEGFDPWAPLFSWTLLGAALYFLHRLLKGLRPGIAKSLTAASSLLLGITALLTVFAAAEGELEVDWYIRTLLYLIEAGVLLLWAIRRRSGVGAARMPLLLTAWLFSAAIVIAEIGWEYAALVLLVAAVLMQLGSVRVSPVMRPSLPLSAPLFWAGLLLLPLVALDYDSFRIASFSADWWRALFSGLAAAAYIAAASLARSAWQATVPEDGKGTEVLRSFIGRYRHRALFLPFFVVLVIFFLLSATGPVLTTLLIIESFVIFSMGILLGEVSFRPFAYALLLFSLVRLILFDMAAADTLERALVFIIAGAVLLGMNWMYNRFTAKDG